MTIISLNILAYPLELFGYPLELKYPRLRNSAINFIIKIAIPKITSRTISSSNVTQSFTVNAKPLTYFKTGSLHDARYMLVQRGLDWPQLY